LKVKTKVTEQTKIMQSWFKMRQRNTATHVALCQACS
jgi:hypothetical protein